MIFRPRCVSPFRGMLIGFFCTGIKNNDKNRLTRRAGLAHIDCKVSKLGSNKSSGISRQKQKGITTYPLAWVRGGYANWIHEITADS